MLNKIRKAYDTAAIKVTSKLAGTVAVVAVALVKQDPRKSDLQDSYKAVKELAEAYFRRHVYTRDLLYSEMWAAMKTMDPEAIRIIWADYIDRLIEIEKQKNADLSDSWIGILLRNETVSEMDKAHLRSVANSESEKFIAMMEVMKFDQKVGQA